MTHERQPRIVYHLGKVGIVIVEFTRCRQKSPTNALIVPRRKSGSSKPHRFWTTSLKSPTPSIEKAISRTIGRECPDIFIRAVDQQRGVGRAIDNEEKIIVHFTVVSIPVGYSEPAELSEEESRACFTGRSTCGNCEPHKIAAGTHIETNSKHLFVRVE